LEHYRQIFDKKEFRLFDYGSEKKNQHFYGGQKIPPLYPLDRLKNIKIILICGKTDLLSTTGDYNNIKNVLE
jgi:hypothetical protein